MLLISTNSWVQAVSTSAIYLRRPTYKRWLWNIFFSMLLLFILNMFRLKTLMTVSFLVLYFIFIYWCFMFIQFPEFCSACERSVPSRLFTAMPYWGSPEIYPWVVVYHRDGRRPRGRPCTSGPSQLKKDTDVTTATSWRRAVDRQLWREDTTALTGYAIWWWWCSACGCVHTDVL